MLWSCRRDSKKNILKYMDKKILLIIDCQYDFLDGGKLGVNGSIEKVNNLIEYITQKGDEYEVIIATKDWHPISHCSFNINGGIWPIHCLQHSKGSAIYEPLLIALNSFSRHFEVLTKGINDDHEEYSIFKNDESSEKIKKLVENFGITQIDVCGVALDYCVKDTLYDAKRALPQVKVVLLKDFSPAIGNQDEILKEIENMNFEII